VSFSFDGVDDVLDSGAVTSLGLIVTFFARIKPTGWGENNRGVVIGWGASADGSRYHLALSLSSFGTNTATFGVSRVGQARWNFPNNTIQLNQWQSIAATFDGTVVANDPRLYHRGLEVARVEVAQGSGALTQTPTTTYVGNADVLSRTFEGLISEAVIWLRVLAPEEIALVHLRGPLAVLRGLYLWWRGSPTATGRDLSGNGRPATVTGAVFNGDHPRVAMVP